MPQYGYSDPLFSWNKYTATRPDYPLSLWNRIFEHHDKHGSGQYTNALDLGAGSGAASYTLVQKFTSVTVSDPTDSNLYAAMENLARLQSLPYAPDTAKNCRIAYIQGPAEDMSTITSNSMDMVTMFEAIHWTDAPKAVEEAARMLKPGGTFAVVYYCPRPSLPDNQRAAEAFNQLFDEWCLETYRTQDPDSAIMQFANPQGNTGLRFVPLPRTLFESGARRIWLNTQGRGESPFSKSTKKHFDRDMSAEDRVGETDIEEAIDEERAWEYRVELDWFRRIFESMTLDFDGEQKASGAWKQLAEALKEEGAKNETTRIVWAVAVILATKKR